MKQMYAVHKLETRLNTKHIGTVFHMYTSIFMYNFKTANKINGIK
jgi:hypothetical protein